MGVTEIVMAELLDWFSMRGLHESEEVVFIGVEEVIALNDIHDFRRQITKKLTAFCS